MTTATTSDSIWRRLWYTRFRDMIRGRWDASLDWRQVIAAAGLPEELSNTVSQVVGKSRLWRREKVAVATELVSHFQDGLEAGASAEALRESFGDPLAAAQLIRRAKRRNRSLVWYVWHYGWICLLVLAALYVATGLWMALGRPTVRVDYLAEINKAPLAVPENERAWPLYRDAFLAMGFDHREEGGPVASFLASDAKPGDPAWKDREQFLTDNAASIAKLREAASRPNLGFVGSVFQASYSDKDIQLFGWTLTPEQIEAARHETLQDRWIISTLLPHMQFLRNAGVLLAADARRAAAANDADAAYANIIALLSASRQCEEIPFVVCVLVSEAIQHDAREAVRDILENHAALWTDGQLRDLAHAFAASRINWQRGLDGETMSFYDSMQRLYTDNGQGDGRLAFRVNKNGANVFQIIDMAIVGDAYETSRFADDRLAVLTMPAANMVVASRKEMTEAYDKLTNHVRAQIEIPLWQQEDESLDSELSALVDDPLDRFRYLFVGMLMPAYDNLRNKIIVSDGERDGVFLGLALELYHRKHGKWPTDLAQLSPQWLPAVPVDRITGKPLHYKVVDDRPVVYSTGPDSDDDGGRALEQEVVPRKADEPPADGDWVIWPTATKRRA